LRFGVSKSDRQTILGDLEEEYRTRVRQRLIGTVMSGNSHLIQSVFRSAARRRSVGMLERSALAAPVTEKRIGLSRRLDAAMGIE